MLIKILTKLRKELGGDGLDDKKVLNDFVGRNTISKDDQIEVCTGKNNLQVRASKAYSKPSVCDKMIYRSEVGNTQYVTSTASEEIQGFLKTIRASLILNDRTEVKHTNLFFLHRTITCTDTLLIHTAQLANCQDQLVATYTHSFSKYNAAYITEVTKILMLSKINTEEVETENIGYFSNYTIRNLHELESISDSIEIDKSTDTVFGKVSLVQSKVISKISEVAGLTLTAPISNTATIISLQCISYSYRVFQTNQRRRRGSIDSGEFGNKLVDLTTKLVCRTSGTIVGCALGHILIPVPVLGTAVGSIVGSVVGNGIGALLAKLFLKLKEISTELLHKLNTRAIVSVTSC